MRNKCEGMASQWKCIARGRSGWELSPIELNGRLEPTGAPLVRRRSVRENEGE